MILKVWHTALTFIVISALVGIQYTNMICARMCIVVPLPPGTYPLAG
jgi:hypothetical protein